MEVEFGEERGRGVEEVIARLVAGVVTVALEWVVA